MKTPIKYWKWLSDDGLRELYEVRKALAPMIGNRTRSMVFVSGVMLALLMGFIATLTWIRQDIKTYLQSNPRIKMIEDKDAAIHVFRGKSLSDFTSTDSAPIAASPFGLLIDEKTTPFYILEFSLSNHDFKDILQFNRNLVIAFPILRFQNANIFVNGIHSGSFVDSSPITVGIPSGEFAKDLKISLVVKPNPLQKYLIDPEHQEPLFVAPARDYQDYTNFLALYRAGRNGFASLIARIVMAIFVLVLFLFVDSSPESLGLALFLGFEGFALSITYGWLPIDNIGFLMHYSSQMGDILRVYFVLQLARLIPKNVLPWLIWGTVASIPYGLLRHYEQKLGFERLTLIPLWRDVLVGSFSTLVCVRVAWYLRGKNQPFRMAALVVAGIGFFQQFLEPLSVLAPELLQLPNYMSFMNIYTAASYYLMALSAFINISTLENRVRMLSGAQTKADMIEKELEMGRTVQSSLLQVPTLPEDYKLAYCHKPAVYISGDTFFVHWDKNQNKLTLLLNDVTGHGIHAALKASACNAIARTLWYSRQDTRGIRGSRLAAYDRLIQEFIDSQNLFPKDINAMIGAEFDEKDEKIILYRANFCFPLLVTKNGTRFEVNILPIHNRKLDTISFPKGSVLLLLSDGFTATSQEANDLTEFLTEKLNLVTSDAMDVNLVKFLVVDWRSQNPAAHQDDETLLGFQWAA